MFLSILMYSAVALAAPVQGRDVVSGENIEVKAGTKGTVLVFLSAKCPCSASHVGEIRKLSEEFKDFRFFGVHSNTNEDKPTTQTYFKNAELGFPVIQDTGAKIADQYRALKTPHAFLLSKDGEPLYKGGVTDSRNCDESGRNFLREALEDANQGKKVRTPEARTLGCAIARGDKNVW